ncbi:hypothetical protein LINPERPRIM_LOCUS20920 [Linum perenne]
MKTVPPDLITPEGVSWLASQIGRPINKFVRDELNVKVCIVKDSSKEMQEEIVVDTGEEEPVVIQIEVPKVRSYKKPEKQLKATVPQSKVAGNIPLGREHEGPYGQEGSPENGAKLPTGGGEDNDTKTPIEVEVSNFQQNNNIPFDVAILSPDNVEGDGLVVCDDKLQVSKGANRTVFVATDDDNAGQKVSLTSATFGDFFIPGKIMSPKGIVTRQRTRRR